MMKRIGLAGLAILFLCVVQISAQSKTTGVLGGTVKDPSGAVVPQAKVTATSADTAVSREALSEANGEYRILLIPPGTYDLKVEHSGFITQVRKGVEITVGQTVVIDFALAIGSTTQMVEVTGEAPLVETERSQQANTIGQEAVRNLPINRRDYLTFALLAPGIADSKALADNNSFRVKQTPDSGISFYGSNGRGNNITIDGGEANDSGGGVRTTVGMETVQEFQINRTNFNAEHGGARGGVINIVTKSGGNNVHGSAFGFFRHQNLDAGDPFAIVLSGGRPTRVKPDSSRQQFGFTLGGPVVKERTFYYAGYEQLRRRESAAVPVLTDLSIFQPTAAQNAILNGLPADAAAPLRAALTAPQSTIDLFTRNSGVFPFLTDSYQFLLRLDHNWSDRNQVNFRYNYTHVKDTNPNLKGLVGFSRGFEQTFFDSTGLLGWTHSFSPSMINEARVQFNYYDALTEATEKFGPEININGFGFFNRDIFLPSDSILRRTDMVDNLTVSRRSHTWKIGGQVLVRNNNSFTATFFPGRFTFGGLPGALVNPALASTTINSLQAFNLGLAQSFQQGFGDGVVRATYPLYGMYVQDTWKARSNLTLNYGLRYEIDTRKSPLPTDKNNFAPRFGFAWDPFHDKKTTIRGGYGLFFATIDYQIDYVVNALNEINGFRQIAQVLTTGVNPAQVNGPVNIFTKLRQQGVIGVPTPTRSITAADLAQFGINISQTGPRPPLTVLFKNSADYQNPYTQQASFGIEREIRPGLSAAASYIWSRGLKLTKSRDDNLLPAPVCPTLGIRYWGAASAFCPAGSAFFKQPLLFQDDIYESTGKSWYNGLILEMNARLRRNVTFSANYTFSKAIDETLDFNSDFQANDQTNLRAEKAVSSFDQRHKVVMYSQLSTPRWDGRGTAWQKFAADFTFTPIYRYNSSRPFNLLAGTDLNGDRHSTTDRPAFLGRNAGIGPSFWTFDLRIARKISLGETRSLELLVEGFNLFNHLNYASVNNTVCASIAANACRADLLGTRPVKGLGPTQPLAFTSAFDPRKIQLGLRFSF